MIQYRSKVLETGWADNQQTVLDGYLAFFSGGGGYVPPTPNPNVIGFDIDDRDALRPWKRAAIFYFNLLTASEALITPATTTVPNVVGLNAGIALGTLQNLFLSGTISNQDVPFFVPYNTVYTQSIAAGTSVGQGTIVNLVVQDLTFVPAVIGLTQAAAQAAINAAFLTSLVVPQVSAFPAGTVFLQSPQFNTPAHLNDLVTITVAVNGDGFRVQAVTAGWYNGTYYNVGDIFDLLQASDFSDSTLNYEIAGGEYNAGWMIQTDPSAPLTQDDGNAFFPAVDPNRRFVE